MSTEKKHILVIRLSAMGDVAMTIPVLRALLQQNSDLKITVLTKKFYAPLFKDLAEVLVYEVETGGEHKGVTGLHKLARLLNKNHKFYAIADLHNVLRSKILKQFINSLRFITLDKGRKDKKDLIKGKMFEQLKTTQERYADVFRSLGFTVDLKNPIFPLPKILPNGILKITGDKKGKWIGIAPFAAHESKMYPLQLMEKIIIQLSKDHKIFLFGGGKKEITILNEMSHKYSNTVNIAGKLNLNGEMDVISNLDLMLSMDSGNAHIAAMLGVKVITLWGVTHPYSGFAPFNQPDDYMLLADRNKYPKIPTSVYGNKFPKGYEMAIASILPQEVVEKVKSVI